MQGEPKKDYLKELKKRTIWRRIVACLAVVVAVSTGYALILPAVTMEQQAVSESKKETEADWEGTLPDALTGEWGTDLAAVAQSQVGYAESSTDTAVNDAGEACGYTRYGAWYGEEYGDWNGMFLAFCLHYAEIPEDAVKASADVSEMLKAAQEKGFYKEAGQYEPEVGDIAFLPDTQAGIVTAVSPEGVSVTAGDINGTAAVIEKAEPLGYGSMNTAASIYTENEADCPTAEENGDKLSGQNSGTSSEILDDENEIDDEAGTEGQTDTGTDTVQDSLTQNGTEQTDETSEYIEQNLKDYVLNSGYGSEEPNFTEKLLDENGQEIEKQEDEKYHIYENESYSWYISFYAPKGITAAGTYVYEMPVGITVSSETYDVTADDGTIIGQLSVDADGKIVRLQIKENTKIRLRVSFELSLDIQKDESEPPIDGVIEFEPAGQKGTVEKSGKINSDGNLEWSVTVRLPGWQGAGNNYRHWYLLDSLSGFGSKIKDGNVEITYGGRTHILYSTDNADSDDEIAYYITNDSTQGASYLYFVSRTSSHSCSESGSNRPDGLPEGWCTDWVLREDAVVNIKYTDLSFVYGKDNFASNEVRLIDQDQTTGQGTNVDSDYVRLEFPDAVSKDSLEDGAFLITVNQKALSGDNKGEIIDLSGNGPIVIHDKMSSGMVYRLGSMAITAVDEEGVEQILIQGQDYQLEISEEDDGQVMKITLLHPGKYEYRITYGVLLESVQTDDSYKNTATVEIFGKEFTDESSKQFFTSTAEEYVLSIHKTDQDDPERVVPGATYGIFSSQGELLSTVVTDENGNAQFTGKPSEGFILSDNMLYYLEETAAPEGYQVSGTRYWFYYSSSDKEIVDSLIDTARFEGFYRDSDVLEDPIPNRGYTETSVSGSDTGSVAEPIQVQDQRIWYELPETGSTGTRMYTIAGLLLTGSAVTALYREKCKKRRKKFETKK